MGNLYERFVAVSDGWIEKWWEAILITILNVKLTVRVLSTAAHPPRTQKNIAKLIQDEKGGRAHLPHMKEKKHTIFASNFSQNGNPIQNQTMWTCTSTT